MNGSNLVSLAVAGLAGLALLAPVTAQDPPKPSPPSFIKALHNQTDALGSMVESPLGRAFLQATQRLPEGQPRVIFRDPENRKYYSPAEALELPDAERDRLEKLEPDAETFYTTKYGTPLAYVRAIDLVGQRGMSSFKGRRILDYGYGTLGHLRLFALGGATAVGVDVDSYLKALYSKPEDQGRLDGAGRVQLVDGFWPGTPAVREAVGQGYDLFLSKNTLKRGYIHPEREADPRRLLTLGVEDRDYVAAMFASLNPGGLAMIYNLSPAQNPPDKPYLPWADGRFPFDREIVESVGFEVLAWDIDDSAAARKMGRLLGWDGAGMDLEAGLFAHFTILRKPAG